VSLIKNKWRVIKIYEKTISKIIIKISDQIIAVSNSVKENAIKLGGIPKKISVIPNGIDLEEFNPNDKKNFSIKEYSNK